MWAFPDRSNTNSWQKWRRPTTPVLSILQRSFMPSKSKTFQARYLEYKGIQSLLLWEPWVDTDQEHLNKLLSQHSGDTPEKLMVVERWQILKLIYFNAVWSGTVISIGFAVPKLFFVLSKRSWIFLSLGNFKMNPTQRCIWNRSAQNSIKMGIMQQ